MIMDAFTESFKFYKNKGGTENKFLSVIDLNVKEQFKDKLKLIDKALPDSFNKNVDELGLIPQDQWQVFSLTEHEGSFIIKNPFTNQGKKLWTRRCLESYPLAPNINNTGTVFNSQSNPWTQLNETADDKLAKSTLSKLHWVTLGYHHNWDTKVYDFENASEFPPDLGELVKCITNHLGFKNFRSEAAIINYYSTKSTIGGHTDHSELDHAAPLVSISFGLTGLFLLGGLSKDVKPTAIFLRSGDVFVMSGCSRLAYHAVPLVLGCQFDYENEQDVASKEDNKLNIYAKTFRININVRQVFTSEKN